MSRLRNPGDYFRSFPIVRVAGLVVAALALFSQAALAGNGIRVLRGTVGAATTEAAEVILVNQCKKAVTARIQGLNVFAQGGDDRVFVEEVDIPPGGSEVLPILEPDPTAVIGRRHIDLAVEYAQCRGALVVAVAVKDSQGRQVATSAGLRSDGELVQAVSEKIDRPFGHRGRGTGRLLRLGDAQAAEIVVVNRCRVEVVYRVLTRNIATEEQEPFVSETEILLAPGDGSVIPVDEAHKDWIVLLSVAQPVHKPGSGRSIRRCSRGRVDASITVINGDGGTQQVALLLPAVNAARETAR